MNNELNNILIEFEEALNSNNSYELIIAIFQKMKSSFLLDEETLPKFFEMMYQFLYYKNDKEIYPNYTAEMHIRACAVERIGLAFCQRPKIPKYLEDKVDKNTLPPLEIKWDVTKAQQYLSPFIQYLANHPSMGYWDWQLFTKSSSVIQSVFEEGLLKMEEEGKREKGYVAGLQKALELKKLEEKIKNSEIVWNDVKDDLISLLDHQHFMVRAGAAKNIGKFYSYKIKDYDNSLPLFLNMLKLIGKKEIEKPGVLGPFIDGYDAGCEGISSLRHNEEIIKSNFDIPNYILEILEKSAPEPYIPNAQSIEFYAHEYFEGHPINIKRIIKMGKEELAFSAATNLQQKIEGMNEVLKLLSNSTDKRIATYAKEHLKKYYE